MSSTIHQWVMRSTSNRLAAPSPNIPAPNIPAPNIPAPNILAPNILAPYKPAPNEPAASGADLSREAVRLLLALDATRTIRALPSKYPHVLNKLASVWSVPATAQRCLEELLLSSRSSRQGFPPAVIAELVLLQGRNSKRLPRAKQDVWSQTMMR